MQGGRRIHTTYGTGSSTKISLNSAGEFCASGKYSVGFRNNEWLPNVFLLTRTDLDITESTVLTYSEGKRSTSGASHQHG